MKRFFILIIAIVFVASCGTTRHVVADHHQTTDVTGVSIRNEIEKMMADSIHTSMTNVQITTIEFIDRHRADSSATDPVVIVTKDDEDDASVRDQIASVIAGRIGDIKSITTVDINRSDSTATSSSGSRTVSDSTKVVAKETVDDHMDDTKDVAGGSKGSMKMKAAIWITIVLLLIGAFFWFFGFRRK